MQNKNIMCFEPMLDNAGVLRERPAEFNAQNFEPGTSVRLLSKGRMLWVPRLPIRSLNEETNTISNFNEVCQMSGNDVAVVCESKLDANGNPICKIILDEMVGWVYTVLLQSASDWYIPYENY